MSVLAALAWLASHPGEVLLVLADESIPPPLAKDELAAAPLAVALLLRTPGGSTPGPRLAAPRRLATATASPALPADLARSAIAPALDLVRALGEVRAVALEGGPRPWGVDVQATRRDA
jgi:hypothetical protein